MKYIKFILITIILYSCKGTPVFHNEMKEYLDEIAVNGKQSVPIYIYTVDSCEYVGIITNHYAQFLTHKGNCKFCTKRNN